MFSKDFCPLHHNRAAIAATPAPKAIASGPTLLPFWAALPVTSDAAAVPVGLALRFEPPWAPCTTVGTITATDVRVDLDPSGRTDV